MGEAGGRVARLALVVPTLRFRLNPVDASSNIAFELAAVDDNETVGGLKERVSERVGLHPAFFVLQAGGRPLKLSERVVELSGVTVIDVAWETCSHGAPKHPITGESPCFWDGGPPSSVVEY